MAWYGDKLRRHPITIDNTAGGAGAADYQITIPTWLDIFWDEVLSTHFDVVVTGPGGNLLVFDFSSWTYATQTAVIDVDGQFIEAGDVQLAWVYWSEAGAADESAATAIAAPLTSYFNTQSPRAPIVAFISEAPGVERPSQEIAKTSNEEMYIWWDVTDVRAPASHALNGALSDEEIDSITAVVVDLAGAAQAAMIEMDKTLYIQSADNRLYIGTFVKGGSTGVNYTVRLVINMADIQGAAQDLEARTLLRVIDPDET